MYRWTDNKYTITYRENVSAVDNKSKVEQRTKEQSYTGEK